MLPIVRPTSVPALRAAVGSLAIVAALSVAPAAAQVEERAPAVDAPAEVFDWESTDGLRFRYRAPASYDPEEGVGLTLILHGSNLSRTWGFANHRAETFRPDDVVVSPEGTTPNGSGGFNFMGNPDDAERLHSLIEELREVWSIRDVYLYGHSQGSFFAFYYAGRYPDEVDGIVGHASGVWTQTDLGKHGHHQAIVLLHGTLDPVVPYRQSVGGYEAFEKAKYPKLRLRSLEGWNHWPSEHNFNHLGQAVPHTSQQLAWVEGMTTDRAARLEWCFDFLAANELRERADYAAIYTLARHVAEGELASPRTIKRAERVVRVVEELAEDHAKALRREVPKTLALDGEGWSTHLMLFLRTFGGVPARDDLFESLERKVEKNVEEGREQIGDFWEALRDGDRKEAFEVGVEAIEDGFLEPAVGGGDFLSELRTLREAAEELKIKRKWRQRFDDLDEEFTAARKAGGSEFDKLNRKGGELP